MVLGVIFPSISLNDKTFLSKTLVFAKASTRTLTTTLYQFSTSTTNHSSSLQFSHGRTMSDKESAVRFDDMRRNWDRKRALFEKLRDKDSNPVRVLEDDGDWSKELFWAVVGFLNQTARSNQVLQVFDKWKSKDDSRVSNFNYERIIRLLADEGLVEAAVLALREMMNIQRMKPSSEMYDLIIHGFTRKGRFDDALFYLTEMEAIELTPHTETYNRLIKAYSNNRLYDEMAKCVKRMSSNGCFPDQSTYNLLIREFSRAGLIKKMERTYQIMLSKRMDLEGSTMVAMLETYASFRDWEKMEKVYRKVLKLRSKVYVKDDLIRKVGAVYIENFMFSRLDDMGVDLSLKTGKTDMVWCLRMLSRACLLSRNGMDSLVWEMESEKVPWSLTVTNLMLLAYAKMKDMRHFKVVLSEMAARMVKPDVVTYGVLFDAIGFGFDGDRELRSWRKMGFLEEPVEMNSDPLVLTAFGKGEFLRICEHVYYSQEYVHKRRKMWTYEHLIKMVKLRQRESICSETLRGS